MTLLSCFNVLIASVLWAEEVGLRKTRAQSVLKEAKVLDAIIRTYRRSP